MDDVRWLTDEEQDAWRALAAVVLRLPAALERQLQRDSQMSHFEYWVLALTSEEPDRSVRLSALATHANASLSRLSHVITRLERRGWVKREPDPDDARATRARLTHAGWRALVAAAPGHVEAVRRLILDVLEPDDVAALARIADRIAERLREEPAG